MDANVANGHFRQAAEFFVETVGHVRPEQWDAPGLGEWSVRELVGHTGRALSVTVDYLQRGAERVEVEDPIEYFVIALRGGAAGAAAVAQRGREAGAALGSDPHAAVRATAERAIAVVEGADGEQLVGAAAGGMRLRDYLPTRTFELIVHTLDLARAIGQSVEPPAEPLAASLEIATQLALRRGHGPAVLHALTGRRGLPAGFSIV
jgi:uncharacterized protein (TIGR03083 family)